ncbi:MAG TPA: AtzH-like domain-containing protein [Acidimicrobiales bacterium]
MNDAAPEPAAAAARRAEDEVRACFEAYERALLANDVETMDGWFTDDPSVVRFGIADCQHGPDQISAWRRTAEPVPVDRRHVRTTVTALGPDVVLVALEFANGDRPGRGRQSQVWQRTAVGWRVAHAHVSMID